MTECSYDYVTTTIPTNFCFDLPFGRFSSFDDVLAVVM